MLYDGHLVGSFTNCFGVFDIRVVSVRSSISPQLRSARGRLGNQLYHDIIRGHKPLLCFIIGYYLGSEDHWDVALPVEASLQARVEEQERYEW